MRRLGHSIVTVALFFAALMGKHAAAEGLPSWSQWRGPAGQGHAPAAKDLPRVWSESENIAWKTPVEGKGWSSPVLDRGRLWLTTAVEQQRQATAANSKTNEPQFLKIQSVSADINVQAITRRFGGLVALNSVSLDIQAGHITALVGPNGSGKSTLVNIIAGVFPPTSGQVFLQGSDVTAQADVEMAKKGVVRTFQDPRLVPHFTVRENIMLGAHAMMHYTWLEAGLSMPRVRLQEAQALEQCNEILQLLDIEAVADQAVESLPYGYRRMTELGRALLARPKIILLDEPAAGLSDVEMTRLAEILVKLKHLGITVLLIEHHMDFLTGLVDEVVVLDSGSIIFKGDMLGMRQDPKVIAAYLGDDEVQHA